MAAERRVDAHLTHECVVEAQMSPRGGGDGVTQHAVGSSSPGVHPYQQAGVAALLQHLRVTGPGVVGDPLAVGVQQLRDQ